MEKKFKHLRRFFESAGKEDILNNLVEIMDHYGDPRVIEERIGSQKQYRLIWKCGDYNFTGYQDMEGFAAQIEKMGELMDSMRAAAGRLGDEYSMQIKISGDALELKFDPKFVEGGDDYAFLANQQDSRTLNISSSELKRFLFVKGYSIKDIDEDWDELSQTGDLTVILNKDMSGEDRDELLSIIEPQVALWTEEYGKNVEVHVYNRIITFECQDEKVSVFLKEED